MKKIFDKKLKIFGLFISVFSFLASCSTTSRKDENNDSSEREEAIVTRILEESDPIAEIHVGPFEPLDGVEAKEVDSNAKTYDSSTILDMPRNNPINVVYDNSGNRTLQSVSCLLNNIVEENNYRYAIVVSVDVYLSLSFYKLGDDVYEIGAFNNFVMASVKYSAKAVLQHSNDGKFKNNFDTRLSLTTKALYYSADMIDWKK